MEINNWYSAFRCYPYNTNYPKQSFPFYVQIKHRSTVHTILIVTPPIPVTHQNIHPVFNLVVRSFIVVTFVCVDFAVGFVFSFKQKSPLVILPRNIPPLCAQNRDFSSTHVQNLLKRKKIINFLEAKSNCILRTLENPSYFERYTFKSKRPHKIHLPQVPQDLSYGIFHESLPAAAARLKWPTQGQ